LRKAGKHNLSAYKGNYLNASLKIAANSGYYDVVKLLLELTDVDPACWNSVAFLCASLIYR
jgi:hypothetical protein